MKQKQTLTMLVCAALAAGSLGGTAYAADADYQAKDITVTAERIPSEKMETPADTTVITADEIAENHYKDAAEALASVPGVVMTNGANGAEQIVRINGDERVVVLVDGERMNDDNGSMSRASATLTRVPAARDIARIEVARGGGSALYGSDAVGGVVNIITKKPTQGQQTSIDLQTGSWRSHRYSIKTQGKTDTGFSYLVSGGIERRGYMNFQGPLYQGQSDASRRMPHSDYRNDDGYIKLAQDLGHDDSLTASFHHYSQDANRWLWNKYTNPVGFYPSYKHRALFNDASLTYRFQEKSALPGFIRYYNHFKTVDFSGKFHTRLQGLEAQQGWQLDPRNKFIAGAEWRRSVSSNAGSGYIDKGITNTGVYLQDTMAIAPKWSFVPGVRMDHHSKFGTHWSPKAALNYRADQTTRAFASWGRVFKAPTADDMFYTDGAYMFGNPNLNPETGHTESVGVSHAFSKNTMLDASMFWSSLNDAIVWAPSTGYVWKCYNMQWEKKRGLNLRWTQTLSKTFDYDLAYTYTDTNVPSNYTNSTGKSLRYYMQPNAYQAGLHYHEGAWAVNMLCRMVTGLDKATYGEKNYTLLDLRTEYHATDALTLYLNGLNLTDEAYSEYTGTQYPAPGRYIGVGMNLTF
ncbi:MAG: TonB-dependent receptor [Selenomonadaceae bacterium]|nr:TonB-dependent receptor [Selenomonadaceae bacterium]